MTITNRAFWPVVAFSASLLLMATARVAWRSMQSAPSLPEVVEEVVGEPDADLGPATVSWVLAQARPEFPRQAAGRQAMPGAARAAESGMLRGTLAWKLRREDPFDVRIEAESGPRFLAIDLGFVDDVFHASLPCGAWRVRAVARGQASAWSAVAVHSEREVELSAPLRLLPVAELRGMACRSQGQAAARFAVTLRRSTDASQPPCEPLVVWTDDDGRFACDVAAGSQWELHAGLPDQAAGPKQHVVARDPFEGCRIELAVTAHADLQMQLAGGASGRLTESVMTLRSAVNAEVLWRSVVDSLGAVRFWGLAPGPYEVDVQTALGSAKAHPILLSPGPQTIEVPLALRRAASAR